MQPQPCSVVFHHKCTEDGLALQSGIALGLRGAVAFEVEAQTVDMDLHSGNSPFMLAGAASVYRLSLNSWDEYECRTPFAMVPCSGSS